MIQVTTPNRRQCESETCTRAGTVHVDGLELPRGLDLCPRCARTLAARLTAALAPEED
jgi:hypothetical protein